jgi:hypothetical protein
VVVAAVSIMDILMAVAGLVVIGQVGIVKLPGEVGLLKAHIL